MEASNGSNRQSTTPEKNGRRQSTTPDSTGKVHKKIRWNIGKLPVLVSSKKPVANYQHMLLGKLKTYYENENI